MKTLPDPLRLAGALAAVLIVGCHNPPCDPCPPSQCPAACTDGPCQGFLGDYWGEQTANYSTCDMLDLQEGDTHFEVIKHADSEEGDYTILHIDKRDLFMMYGTYEGTVCSAYEEGGSQYFPFRVQYAPPNQVGGMETYYTLTGNFAYSDGAALTVDANLSILVRFSAENSCSLNGTIKAERSPVY